MESHNLSSAVTWGIIVFTAWGIYKAFFYFDWIKAWKEEQEKIKFRVIDDSVVFWPGSPESWKKAWEHTGAQELQFN